ncbi:MAG: hypothetical protein ABIK09_20760 [Pseudomonadota bacterium]
MEKPYPWRLAPEITEVGREACFEWFAERAVDEDTRAFVRGHGPALAEVRLGLEQTLKPVDGATLMTRATKPGEPQLKSAASVEEKILRIWKASGRAWSDGLKGLFAKGATLGEARQQVFDAAPDDPRALTDVAGLRVVVPTLAALDKVVADRRAAWKGRIIKHRDYVGEDHRGDGYRSVHFVIEARGRPVEVQLRTTRMHRWAGWEHRIVYKGTFKGDATVRSYTKAVGDRLHRQDLGTCKAPCPLPACPAVLKDAGGCFQEAR